ncbi:MAG: N-acetylmuramoyl-L-alanine amidase [Gammaproteobacteria bacterium]|nr:N-acetylmuramoyl-L-alanine amidase [Gammaproteobacteria bacterium]
MEVEEELLMPEGDDTGPAVPDLDPGEIRYGKDRKGEFAAYKMKKGEALYTSVVIRLTDFREVILVQEAAEEVLKRNGISDPRKIHVGQEIRVPLDMVSDRYQPPGSAPRMAYEAANQDARKLRATAMNVKDLDGVAIVLDPGHGGCDQGANHGATILEDEINYDIAVRIKRILEQTTRARVYMTLKDLSQGYEPNPARAFPHDTDEVVLTDPPYAPLDVNVSANLRWYVSNGIYRQELARGTKPENVLFASIHCDALYEKLRGTMVYIPGAAYREGTRTLNEAAYARYTKAGHATGTSNAADRRRDEALSRNFAETLLYSLQTHNPPIAVHRTGDPIRNVIQRTRTSRYVPAVLRFNDIPTKVLVETANLKNATDRERAIDPEWREWYAQAFVNAVKRHFTT